MKRWEEIKAAKMDPERKERLDAEVKGCLGVIPNTFIACGESGNYCSDECMQEKDSAYRLGLERGFALAFGIIGMAEAIKKNARGSLCETTKAMTRRSIAVGALAAVRT